MFFSFNLCINDMLDVTYLPRNSPKHQQQSTVNEVADPGIVREIIGSYPSDIVAVCGFGDGGDGLVVEGEGDG